MSKHYQSSGNPWTVLAPANVTVDVPLLIGSVFAIPTETVASGKLTAFTRSGQVTVPKATGEAWTAGAKVYWDDTAKKVTTTSSGNSLIGAAAVLAASGDTVGFVLLNGTTI